MLLKIGNTTWVSQKAYEQWLYADLSELSYGFLPNCLNERKATLQEDLVLQINSIQDVGKPSYAQLQQIQKDDIQDNQVDTDKVKPQMWEPKPTRMLLLTLTDGVSTVLGMEYTALPCLSLQTQPGTKMMIRRGCVVRRGVLLLTSSVITVLGGAVDTLFVPNAPENVIRRQLGLEEVDNPTMYEESAVTSSVSSTQASQYYLGSQSQRLGNNGNVGPGNQVTLGSGNQVNRCSANQVSHGQGNQVTNNFMKQPAKVTRTPSKTALPLTGGEKNASDNLESELYDDDFDFDMEAAMLEAEYAHSTAQNSTDLHSTCTSSKETFGSKLQHSGNNGRSGLEPNSRSSNSAPSVRNSSSHTSLQAESTAPMTINLENRIPDPSRVRPKLSYNPFLDSGSNNMPSTTVAAKSKCEEDFDDDGFNDQDLSAIEEELQLVEFRASQGCYDESTKISSECHPSSSVSHIEPSVPLKSKDVTPVKTGPREAPKNFRISVAPQKKTLCKSLGSELSSSTESLKSMNENKDVSRCHLSTKFVCDDNRSSVKRPPDPQSSVPDTSPLSNKLRKLNTANDLPLPSISDAKPNLKDVDEVKNKASVISTSDNSVVKNLAVVSPHENKSLQKTDKLRLDNVSGTQKKTSIIEAAKLGNPITYLMFLPRCPLVEQEFVVKGFVMTLQSRLEQQSDEWKLTVSINDGSAGLDVDIHDQVLRKLIGISVPEMRALRIKASTDASLRSALTQKVTQCREQLISLCSLLTVRVSPKLQRPQVVNITPFTQAHAKLLQQRTQLCLL